jgi:hypothetical protein
VPGQTPIELAERSLQVRRASKRIRDGLASGRLTIADVMRDEPPELGDRALFEILLFGRGFGRHRLRELNARAVAQSVNLAVTLRRADAPTRNWVSANTTTQRRPPLDVWERLML